MDKEVVIVIPVYRQMTVCERVSLVQCIRVLGHYPIVLAAGASLSLETFLTLHPFQVERFDDADFASIQSYSRLLLSDRFYARFADYRYLLIYQLDAFVFSDRLQEFCKKGYDYIGAPVARWVWLHNANRVGNGGFSLRRIEACRRVIRAFPPEQFNRFESENRPEDYYFGACGAEPGLEFHVPPMREAIEFSVDYDVYHCFRRMPEWLPFGCHRWDRENYRHWYPIIERYGYQMPIPTGAKAIQDPWKHCIRYIADRVSRTGARTRFLHEMLDSWIPANRKLVLWGWGSYGKLAFRFLQAADREDVRIFDRKKSSDIPDNLQCSILDFREPLKLFVLVSTLTYEDEISNELEKNGLHVSRDYLNASTFFLRIGEAYLSRFSKKTE